MSELMLWDGLENATSGLGTSRDKAHLTTYTLDRLDTHKVMTMYRGSWLPQKIVNIPADDATREWREWMADEQDIKKIEDEEKRLGVRGKVRKAIKMARLTGGAAILLGTGEPEESLSKPINIEGMKAGGLKYITVLGRNDIQAGDIEYSVASELFGQPKYWQVQMDGGVSFSVHPSRLSFIKGVEVPESGLSSLEFWGDSCLQAPYDIVKNHDSTISNVASLVFEAKIDVIKIPNLMARLREGGLKAEQEFMNRFSIATTGKGNNGTLILDGQEEYSQKTASFGSLPDVVDRFIQEVCGAADIPATRLFGKSPSGLNANGGGELRNYYDMVSALQELDITPSIKNLDLAIKASAGVTDKDAWYKWSPLWQTSAEEKAKIGKTIAETGKILAEADLVSVDALAKAIPSALVESGVMPSLEAAIAEAGELEGELDELELDDHVFTPTLIIDNDPLENLADALERVVNER